jgi:CubicO group peptidase (beta-lactamase class C family)
MNKPSCYPDNEWERIAPQEAGFHPERLKKAVDHALRHETSWPRDLPNSIHLNYTEPPEYGGIIGPAKERGGPNGLIVRGGRIVAEWGDTSRVDMTFSVSKSFLSACAGLAFDRGLIRDVHDPVRNYCPDGGFEPPHNHRITWQHLLQQTSEWEGILWGKPDLIDRNREVGTRADNSRKGTHRDLRPSGAFWEYNDVRVNRLSLSLLRVWRRPLPEVLKEFILDPIGASPTWEWHGYRNSYVDIDGRRIQSVSGGGHWGGGLFISSRDQARFGLLMSSRGRWGGEQILSERWIEGTLTPCDVNPGYGYLFWLNRAPKRYASAPESSFFALGAGHNVIWIDPDHDLVGVARWIAPEAIDGFLQGVLGALSE